MTIKAIVERISRAKISHRPIMVAVEGFGGAGKSTFASELKRVLGNAYIVNMDEFIVKEKITEPSWDKGGFDRKRLEQQVLIPATSRQPVSYQELLWATNTLSEPKAVPPIDYLIVEGISSYHPDIAHYYDYKIWVDAPIKVAKGRGHARDGSNENAKHWDLWAANDLRYQEKHHPEKQADFIYDNSRPKS